MAKQLLYRRGSSAPVFWKGVNQLADAGQGHPRPKGRNAILDKKFGAPTHHQGRRHRPQGNRTQEPL